MNKIVRFEPCRGVLMEISLSDTDMKAIAECARSIDDDTLADCDTCPERDRKVGGQGIFETQEVIETALRYDERR